MLRWIADNSELRGIWEAEIPDIFFFGGFLADESMTTALCSVIEGVKSRYRGRADFPFKWNFLGLEKYYSQYGLEDLFARLKDESMEWRSEIFRLAAKVEFTIIMSIIKSHSTKREILKKTKEPVTRFVFSNALMRVGLYAKEISAGSTELLLDWPGEGQRGLFDDEYKNALYRGATSAGKNYYCGPLKALGFSYSPLYSNMQECPLLQFSDLLVGALREAVEVALGKKDESLGLDLIRLLKDKFRGAPDSIIGRGISIAPTSGDFHKCLTKELPALLYG